MKIGFTGTRKGMTPAQSKEVLGIMRYLRDEERFTALHHGDCIGADAEAHKIALYLGLAIFVHPPENSALRAYCECFSRRFDPLPYHVRNRNIVEWCEVLIATPAETQEASTGGTWYTIRHARKQKRRIFLIWPDGEVTEET